MSVGAVAKLSGVTVRTLHHYGEIGLLPAENRNSAGYRQYTTAELDRLSQILYYRELGFPLEEIASLLDDASSNPIEHLNRQHALLSERLRRVQAMIAAVERERNTHMSGIELTAEEKFEIFGQSYDPAYEVEAKQRWSDTQAWAQSSARTATFSKADWQKVKADTDAGNARMVAVFNSGALPGSNEANEIAEEHRASINVFYDCGYDMQVNLAHMYLADERFTKTYEDLAPGLTQWLHDGIIANAKTRNV
ncbi:MerR family transcriptional regulator [Nakamurella antarctica]|uniref:MerR family transcriptional regulator n=2 Tax=Nakamurella antarctica TaxID=1902245 RepID=A0A3G9A0Q3_9ACTN|nr:MerR family transcriptional regulator [Nakamurella antarctica]